MNTNPDSTPRNEGGKVEGAETLQGGWRAIETAPRDGTRILAHRESDDEMAVINWSVAGYWQIVFGAYPFRNPEKWMPLPEPPEI